MTKGNPVHGNINWKASLKSIATARGVAKTRQLTKGLNSGNSGSVTGCVLS